MSVPERDGRSPAQRGAKPKLTLEQRIAIRRRVIEERKKGIRRNSRIIEVMHELAKEHGVSFGLISLTVYG